MLVALSLAILCKNEHFHFHFNHIERELDQAWRVVEATNQQGLHMQETESGLMPFMIPVAMAAAEASKSPPPEYFDKEKDAQLSLDLTYRLLRYDPTVLSKFEVTSSQNWVELAQSAEKEEDLSFYKSDQKLKDFVKTYYEGNEVS